MNSCHGSMWILTQLVTVSHTEKSESESGAEATDVFSFVFCLADTERSRWQYILILFT